MSIIEANITIDGGDEDMSLIISQIEQILQQINGKPMSANVIDMDNPITTNPLNYRM